MLFRQDDEFEIAAHKIEGIIRTYGENGQRQFIQAGYTYLDWKDAGQINTILAEFDPIYHAVIIGYAQTFLERT